MCIFQSKHPHEHFAFNPLRNGKQFSLRRFFHDYLDHFGHALRFWIVR